MTDRNDLQALRSSATVVRLPQLPPVDCPCGTARRAFTDVPGFSATVHLTHITSDAKLHYHRIQTEVYVVVACGDDAAIELDGVVQPVFPLTAIHIPPGVRHRAVGEMTVLIYCTPKFDPRDEHFD
jgi:mannose-6-phosphate isomerase-like protein (cupin superfamily)